MPTKYWNPDCATLNWLTAYKVEKKAQPICQCVLTKHTISFVDVVVVVVIIVQLVKWVMLLDNNIYKSIVKKKKRIHLFIS